MSHTSVKPVKTLSRWQDSLADHVALTFCSGWEVKAQRPLDKVPHKSYFALGRLQLPTERLTWNCHDDNDNVSITTTDIHWMPECWDNIFQVKFGNVSDLRLLLNLLFAVQLNRWSSKVWERSQNHWRTSQSMCGFSLTLMFQPRKHSWLALPRAAR